MPLCAAALSYQLEPPELLFGSGQVSSGGALCMFAALSYQLERRAGLVEHEVLQLEVAVAHVARVAVLLRGQRKGREVVVSGLHPCVCPRPRTPWPVLGHLGPS